MSYILSFILTISIIVFIHELGHYVVARLCGVNIDEFSIGFGKILYSKVLKNGEKWKICLLPFGGYVKMKGDTNSSSWSGVDVDVSEGQKIGNFHYKKTWQKALIIFAGPFANYLLSFVIFFILSLSFGSVKIEPIIGGFSENSIAKEYGMQVGDKIIAINGDKISDFSEIRIKIATSVGDEFLIDYQRGDVYNSVKIKPRKVEITDDIGYKVNMFMLGVSSVDPEYVKVGFFDSVISSFKKCYNISKNTLIAIKQLLTGKRSIKELSGPLKIAEYSQKMVSDGLFSFMMFIALISINIGLVNLLPIPVLDGGHLLVYSIETIINRKLPNIVNNAMMYFGVVVIVAMMAIGIFNDVWSLFLKLSL
jgi:regulator of sigma E protease